jgi:hypothetical protein
MDNNVNEIQQSIPFITPFVSPFINPSNFPIEFKVLDTWSYEETYWQGFTTDFLLFTEINKSKTMIDFEQQYKTALSLINLDNNLLNQMIRKSWLPVDLSKCFPFIITNWPIADIWGQISGKIEYYPYYRLKLEQHKNRNIHFFTNEFKVLGDFRLDDHGFIFQENLKQIIVADLMRINLPYITISELTKYLEFLYDDIKYRFTTAVKITDNHSCRVYCRFVRSFRNLTKNPKKFRMFLYPFPNEFNNNDEWHRIINGVTRHWTWKVDNDLVIDLIDYFPRLEDYILIYSNTHPNLIPEVSKFLEAVKYVADSITILEVKNKLNEGVL